MNPCLNPEKTCHCERSEAIPFDFDDLYKTVFQFEKSPRTTKLSRGVQFNALAELP